MVTGRRTGRSTSKLTLNLGLRYDVSIPAHRPLQPPELARSERARRHPGAGADTLHGRRSLRQFPRAHHCQQRLERHPAAFRIRLPGDADDRGCAADMASTIRSHAPAPPAWHSYGSQGFNQYTGMIPTYNNDGATPYLHLNNPYPSGLIQPPGNSLGLLNDFGYGREWPLAQHDRHAL